MLRCRAAASLVLLEKVEEQEQEVSSQKGLPTQCGTLQGGEAAAGKGHVRRHPPLPSMFRHAWIVVPRPCVDRGASC